MKRALVLLSGGQDSTTCLFWAKKSFGCVESLCVDYRQRHSVEIKAASRIAAMAGVKNTVVHCSALEQLTSSSLTSDLPVSREKGERGLANTFVPGRNLIFLAYAAARAYDLGISDIVTGVCQTDYAGYPDCREESMVATEGALSLCMDYSFVLHRPLVHLSKAQIVLMAKELGAMDALAHSHTCYNGLFPPCQSCSSCILRAKGFAEAGLEDPLLLRAAGGRSQT